MRTARERGQSKGDWAKICADQLTGQDPADDEDSPDASAAMREEIDRRRLGRPVGSDKSVA
jgi:hypothetical protein